MGWAGRRLEDFVEIDQTFYWCQCLVTLSCIRRKWRDGQVDDEHLMVFHIGPVQEFIAAARRSRDLWFGSWMLSELAKAAALEILEQNGGEESSLIFPAPNSIEELCSERANVPNRIVALTKKDPESVGEAVRNRIRQKLHDLSEDAFSKVQDCQFDLDSARKQVEDLVEVYWVSCPLDGDYVRARRLADALMAARKVTRDFSPSTWGDFVDKCSIDGQREAVIPHPKSRRTSELGHGTILREGEKLCGVCLMKRLGRKGQEDDFLSTSHVAAQPFLNRLGEEHRPHVERYKAKLKQLGMSERELNTVAAYRTHPVFGRTDGHLLYVERLREFFRGEELERAQQALQEFLQAVFGGERPNPYYAMLHADGDNMGKTISAQVTPAKHRELSQAVSGFAAKVRQIVEDYGGSLIYAGGDDVLAMLPLHTVLGCARTLASSFSEEMSSFVAENGTKIQPTLSVSVAVVHHLEPLSRALDLVRETEKRAKAVEGKNAVALTVDKRSGPSKTVAGKWGNIDKRIEWLIGLYRASEIPSQLAYDLQSLVLRLPDTQEDSIGRDIVAAEVRYILSRKKTKGSSSRIQDEIKEKLISLIEQGNLPLQQLVDELIIAREFAAAYNLAGADCCVHAGGGEQS